MLIPQDVLRQALLSTTYQEIFWFYVSVHNIETVKVLDGACQVK